MSLPAEIRVAIFEFVLVAEKPIVGFRLDCYQRDGYQEAIQPALTRTCQQIRREILPVFYGCNDFVLHTESPQDESTIRWLRDIEHHLDLLDNLSVWVRYADRLLPCHGALSISIRREKPAGTWRSSGRWKWVTVTREPTTVSNDAEFLMAILDKMLASSQDFVACAADITKNLKVHYIRHKGKTT